MSCVQAGGQKEKAPSPPLITTLDPHLPPFPPATQVEAFRLLSDKKNLRAQGDFDGLQALMRTNKLTSRADINALKGKKDAVIASLIAFLSADAQKKFRTAYGLQGKVYEPPAVELPKPVAAKEPAEEPSCFSLSYCTSPQPDTDAKQ